MASTASLVIPDRSLRTLEMVASAPFGPAQDYARFEDLHPDRVREKLRELYALDYVDCHSFGTYTLRSERRWWLTTHGYRALLENAQDEARRAMVRRHWSGLGVMARRADVAAVVTRVVARLAPYISGPSPIRFHYFNSGPLDCVVELDGHRFISVIHAGPALRRRSVWARLKTLKEMPFASNYPLLILAPTIFDRNSFLAQIRTLGLNGLVAMESAALDGGVLCWLAPDTKEWVSYKDIAQKRLMSRYFTKDESPMRITDLELSFLDERTTPVRHIKESPALNLSPLGKRLLDTLIHWPSLDRDDAINMLKITGPQLSDLLRSLRALDLITTEEADGVTYYSQSDVAISYTSARDRCDPSAILDLLSVSRRWEVPPTASRKQVIASYRGSLIRSILANREHDSLVTEAMGYVTCELANHSDWRVIQSLPPRRARIALTPDRSIDTLRSALNLWRVLSTKRSGIAQDRSIVVFPDALIYVIAGRTTLRIVLEVELTATTRGEWQDRLESHVMHSLLRSPAQFTLFVVGSSNSEATALAAQTRWVQTVPKRRWPVATTTVDLLRDRYVTDPIWRVDASSEERHSLLALPDLMNER